MQIEESPQYKKRAQTYSERLFHMTKILCLLFSVQHGHRTLRMYLVKSSGTCELSSLIA